MNYNTRDLQSQINKYQNYGSYNEPVALQQSSKFNARNKSLTPIPTSHKPAQLSDRPLPPSVSYTIDQTLDAITNIQSKKGLQEYQAYASTGANNNESFSGLGRLQFPNQDVYEGQFLKGKMHGHGVLISANGRIKYTGQFRNDFKWGKGKLEDNFSHFEYEGTFEKNKIHGEGTKKDYREGTTYFGSFKDGEKHGFGTCQYQNGNRFRGTWAYNIPHKGELFIRSGDRLQGEWKDDRFSGSGIIYFNSGCLYEGEWK